MAHLLKSTRGATGGLTRHFERFKDDKGAYIKFGNQEINIDRSHLNYNLAEDKNQLEFIKKRTSEVRCLNRKDVNVMASWVITLPESLKDPEDQEKFFKESYNFLENKYGKENVISSYVHLDETTPHMHFAFIPVVYDKKREDFKVSAKECITRNDLKRFHPELEAHMEMVFGREIGIMNDKTKEGNKTIEELKKGTARKELSLLEREIEDKNNTLNAIKNDIKASRLDLRVSSIVKADIDKINQIDPSVPLFGKIVIDEKDYNNLNKVAKWSLLDKEKTLYPYKRTIQGYKNKVKELETTVNSLTKELKEREDKEKRLSINELMAEAKMKADHRNEIKDKDKQINDLVGYLIDRGLTEDFNNRVQELNKAKDKSKTKSRQR